MIIKSFLCLFACPIVISNDNDDVTKYKIKTKKKNKKKYKLLTSNIKDDLPLICC